jgi:hypothetical protein
VDGLPFTAWVGGPELRPTLTIDLGTPTMVQRLMLRLPLLPTFFGIEVQTSMDGVQFDTIASAPTFDPVLNLAFTPQTARFVRLQIEAAYGPATIRELVLSPQ